MALIAFSKEQRLLYYHLICYDKIHSLVGLLERSNNPSITHFFPAVSSAYEEIKDICIHVGFDYGKRINDPELIAETRSNLGPELLSQVGLVAFEHIITLAPPVLAYLQEQSNGSGLSLIEREVNQLLTEVISSIQRTVAI